MAAMAVMAVTMAAVMAATTAALGVEGCYQPFVEASGKKYWCYYLHRSRDLVAPVSGIFYCPYHVWVYYDLLNSIYPPSHGILWLCV